MTSGTWQIGTTATVSVRNLRAGVPATTTSSTAQTRTQSLTYGTGSAYFGIAVEISYSLLPGESVTYNLFDGTLTDVFGDAANFRILKSFACWVSSGGDSSGVTIGGGVSNPHTLFFGGTTPTQTVYPDGPAASGGSPAGVAVTSSACTVKVTNNGAAVATFVLLLGGTAAVSGALMGVLGLTYP